jgi:membrane protease subunit HflK
MQEANAYKEQVIAQAQGEAQRFEQLLVEYQKAPEVTRQRLYIDAMQDVLANSSKVMVDVEGGNNMMYLPLDQLLEQQQARRTPVITSGPETIGNQNNSSQGNSSRDTPARGPGR